MPCPHIAPVSPCPSSCSRSFSSCTGWGRSVRWPRLVQDGGGCSVLPGEVSAEALGTQSPELSVRSVTVSSVTRTITQCWSPRLLPVHPLTPPFRGPRHVLLLGPFILCFPNLSPNRFFSSVLPKPCIVPICLLFFRNRGASILCPAPAAQGVLPACRLHPAGLSAFTSSALTPT